MTDTPEDWVLLLAADRGGLPWVDHSIEELREEYKDGADGLYRALCDMIAKHEQKPVDRKLLCAQAAVTGALIELDASRFPKKECMWDCCVRAITLWEEGFGE
jgi:hypothetical protein